MALFLVGVVGCENSPPEHPVAKTAPTQNVLNYPQYLEFVKHLRDNFTPEGYSHVTDTVERPVTIIIEKDISFGKRETLTLTGDMKDPRPLPTQNRVVYQDQNQGYVLYLDVIYTDTWLGDQLLSWDLEAPNELPDVPVLGQSSQSLYSHKNFLVKVTLNAFKGQSAVTILKEINKLNRIVASHLAQDS